MMKANDMKNDEKVMIQIENLHIHMDERMDSTNIYNPESDCDSCDCEECSCGKEQAIDMDELATQVSKDVKFPIAIVESVLQSAEKILIKKGFLEEVEEDTASETESEDESSNDADTEEASELSDEEKEFLDGVVDKLMPGIAAFAFMKALEDLAGEAVKEDEDHGKSN